MSQKPRKKWENWNIYESFTTILTVIIFFIFFMSFDVDSESLRVLKLVHVAFLFLENVSVNVNVCGVLSPLFALALLCSTQ